MGHQENRRRIYGGLLLGAAASGLAAAALSSAGTANATCASISGIGNGGGCTSTPTSFAIGLGPNTTAAASGLFTGAIANGVTNTGAQTTIASSTGALSLAYAGGPDTLAVTQGNLALAVAQGQGADARAGLTPGDIGNVAINISQSPVPGGTVAVAGGTGNIAANLFSNAVTTPTGAQAVGLGNAAFNILSPDSRAVAGTAANPATLSTAFNLGSKGSGAFAGPGPLAIAGTIGQTGLVVVRTTTGFNINGNSFP